MASKNLREIKTLKQYRQAETQVQDLLSDIWTPKNQSEVLRLTFLMDQFELDHQV